MRGSEIKKIKKLKATDRVKIIDRPEILIVQPLTIDASIRYGHKSRWCTHTQGKRRFEKHKRQGVLIYVLIYNVVDGKRDGDAKTKIALYRRFNQKSNWTCYDFNDNSFDYDALKWILDEKYNLTNTINEIYSNLKNKAVKKKVIPHDRKIGEIIKGNGGDVVTIEPLGNWKYRHRRYYRRRRRIVKRRPIKNLQEFARFEIRLSDILKAEIIDISQTTIKVKILKMNLRSTFIKYLFRNYQLITTIKVSLKKQNFIII